MNTETTDYIILMNNTPAFADNNVLMVQNIINAKGTCPSFTIKYKDGDEIPESNPLAYYQVAYVAFNSMPGGKESNGRAMIHFRLPEKLSTSDLEDLLTNGMTPPMSPISVESIRSAYKIIYIDDGVDDEGNPIGHYEYEITVQAKRAKFLPYMPEDEDSNINEFLSTYVGSKPIELA